MKQRQQHKKPTTTTKEEKEEDNKETNEMVRCLSGNQGFLLER